MSFEANNSFVYELFDNRTIFAIPRNQRKYVWSEKNWEDLFKDVDCVVKEIFPAHFIGSIVLKNEGRKNGLQYYSVIDGQQRVITLSIFLSCIMLLLKKHQMSEEFRGITRYIQAKNDNDKDQIMVTSDYHTSLELIVAGFINEKEENLKGVSLASIVNKYGIRGKRDKSVINAFTYFLQKITENVNKQPEASKYLLALRDAVVNISFVSIIATSDEDAYTIFEILNARGCALEDHELIKNYIMRYIQPEETRDTAKKIWSEIENNTGSSIR